ncbi:replication initiation protein [Cetobacterium somerae]|uniref:replication initiation protein n=1 Tax=Cetobacterium somerae TaxID=188913 RepID=UPI00389198DE
MKNTGFHVELLPIKIMEGGKEELSEVTQNFYFKIMTIFNQMKEYKPIEVNKSQLLELLGFDIQAGYDSEKVISIIRNITKPIYFEHKKNRIAGSVFNVWLQEEKDLFIIYFNDPFRQLLFTKKDIEILDKNKKNEKLTVTELDYWDRELKDKSTKLRLLSEAEFLGISGKYSKLVYCLIKVFGKSKRLYMKFDDFKSALNIPTSYKTRDIDNRIIAPAIKELGKLGYKLRFDKKKSIGQGNKITNINIIFNYTSEDSSTIFKKIAENREVKEEEKAPIEKIKISRADYKKLYEKYLEENKAVHNPFMQKTFDLANVNKYEFLD